MSSRNPLVLSISYLYLLRDRGNVSAVIASDGTRIPIEDCIKTALTQNLKLSQPVGFEYSTGEVFPA